MNSQGFAEFSNTIWDNSEASFFLDLANECIKVTFTFFDAAAGKFVKMIFLTINKRNKVIFIEDNASNGGAERTKDLVATKGRASYLGERSLGHRDPGAVSSSFMLRAMADAM